jgi:hypothetical protein
VNHKEFAASADGMTFAKTSSHAGSVAVIGREQSAQDSWDDACTASVPFSGPAGTKLRKW